MYNQNSNYIREHLNKNLGNSMNFGSLPDTTPVNSILKRIANEKNWAEKDVENDLAILERHRIVYVHDLRSLSKDSWTEIELLPLVKDLLRGAIDPDYLNSNNLPSSTLSSGSSNGSSNISQDDDDKKEKKKDKKDKKDDKKDDKDKKEKKKEKEKEKEKEKKKDKKKGFKSTSNLGTPVKPTILTRPPVIYQPQPQSLNDTSSILSDSSISHDHITMQNTIRNGGGSTPTDIKFIPALPTVTTANMNNGSGESSSSTTSEDNDDDFLLSPTTRRKSVSFSNETAIGVAATEKGALDEKKEKKKDKKDKKDKKKKKDNMASTKYSGYSNFTSHPYTTHPIVKFRRMKLKHCQRLPEVPANDSFLQGIHDRLSYAKIDS